MSENLFKTASSIDFELWLQYLSLPHLPSYFPLDEVAAIFLLLLLMTVNERSTAREVTSKS